MKTVVRALLFGLAYLAATAARAAPAEDGPVPTISADCGGAAVGETPPALPHLTAALAERRRIVVLGIGNSMVGGGDVRRGDYYGLVEKVLEKTFKGLDVVMVQRGVSGELARDAADRIRLEVARNDPDVVFWQVGTADALAGIEPAEVVATVRDTARWLAEHGVDVVLIGLHYSPALRGDPQYVAMRDALDAVARTDGLLRIRRWEVGETLDRLRRDRFTPDDAVAATAEADACMAQHLARSLAIALFAKRRPQERRSP